MLYAADFCGTGRWIGSILSMMIKKAEKQQWELVCDLIARDPPEIFRLSGVC
jgi:hypothetical protein